MRSMMRNLILMVSVALLIAGTANAKGGRGKRGRKTAGDSVTVEAVDGVSQRAGAEEQAGRRRRGSRGHRKAAGSSGSVQGKERRYGGAQGANGHGKARGKNGHGGALGANGHGGDKGANGHVDRSKGSNGKAAQLGDNGAGHARDHARREGAEKE